MPPGHAHEMYPLHPLLNPLSSLLQLLSRQDAQLLPPADDAMHDPAAPPPLLLLEQAKAAIDTAAREPKIQIFFIIPQSSSSDRTAGLVRRVSRVNSHVAYVFRRASLPPRSEEQPAARQGALRIR